ncbi:MAG: alpha/beta fold hydrolase [Candidatus Heimdallarchaeota archaeon]|nr:alpha/beta fold hydrolase [Candidatus Heimdallarchaeota archaeon]
MFKELDTFSDEEAEHLFFGIKDLSQIPELVSTSMGDVTSDVGIILQHGFIGANIDWLFVANRLARLGYRVFLPILPGYGVDRYHLHNSQHEQWIENLAQSIELMKQEKPGRKIIIAGHSLGGSIALIQAAVRNDLAGIITVSAPIKYPKIVHLFSKVSVKFLGNVNLRYRNFKFKDKRLHNNPYIIRIRNKFDKVSIYTLNEVIKVLEKTESLVQKVHQPILIIHSKYDKTVPYGNAKRIYKLVGSKDKELMMYKQSYHIILADIDKERLVEDILAFIIKNTDDI